MALYVTHLLILTNEHTLLLLTSFKKMHKSVLRCKNKLKAEQEYYAILYHLDGI